MTDKEKVALLVGFIKGCIGSNTFIASLPVEVANDIIKKVCENS